MQKGKHSLKTFVQKKSAWKYSSGRQLKGCPTGKGPAWEQLFSKVKLHSNQRSLQSWFKAPWLSLWLYRQAECKRRRGLKVPGKTCLTRPRVADSVLHRKPRVGRYVMLCRWSLSCRGCRTWQEGATAAKQNRRHRYSLAAMQSTQFYTNLEPSMEL